MKKQSIILAIIIVVLIVFGIIIVIQHKEIKNIKENINKDYSEIPKGIMYENNDNRPSKFLGEWSGNAVSKLTLNENNGKYMDYNGKEETEFEWYVSDEKYITFISKDSDKDGLLNQTYKYEFKKSNNDNIILYLYYPDCENMEAKDAEYFFFLDNRN